ncbi:MAG: hypothetical protein KQ78_00920 [Candidatus Izimaplasma bacterium HR2]|nr:MAG: hypothetical protein KQ78_00920 [Candidatus Izimaplasma bacterium HR2]
MKKALAILALVAIMISGLGRSGMISYATSYVGLKEALPAETDN